MKPNISQLSTAKPFVKFTDEPKFHYFICHHLNLDGEKSFGSALSDNEEMAILKSYWEALERACLCYCNHENKQEKNLSDGINDKIIVNEFMKPSEQLSLDEIEHLNLYESFDYRTGEKVWLPNQLVFSDYDARNEPFIRIPISTGAAIGKDFDSTFERGFLELIERDSFMLFWLTQKTPVKIDITNNATLQKLNNYLQRYLLHLYVFDITSDLGIPTIMSVLLDYTGAGPAVSVGLKSSFNLEAAINGAIFESLQVRIWLRLSYLQNIQNNINTSNLSAIEERSMLWYGVDSIKKLDFMLCISATPFEEVSNAHKATNFKEWFAKTNFDVFYTDITLPHFKEIGYTCLKVNAPFLHPLYLDERFVYDYSKHLEEYSKAHGLKISNPYPHPFA